MSRDDKSSYYDAGVSNRYQSKVKNELNNIYGDLLVVEFLGIDHAKHAVWKCVCSCGKNTISRGGDLRQGKRTSCGCKTAERNRKRCTVHGNASRQSRSNAYTSWLNMKQRCLNKNHPDYKYYGGRGISICKRWINSFDNFLQDMGLRPEKKSIDRINNNGDYEPNNCRWATHTEQMNNRGRY